MYVDGEPSSPFAISHSSLEHRPPAPEGRLTETFQGYGKVETEERFPLFRIPAAARLLTQPLRYTNSLTGTKHWTGQSFPPLPVPGFRGHSYIPLHRPN